MKKLLLTVPALVALVGCKSPMRFAETVAQRPVAVVVSVPADLQDRQALEALYVSAIEARLAEAKVRVVRAQDAPPEAYRLAVDVTGAYSQKEVVAGESADAFVGWSSGGTLYRLGQNENFGRAVKNGLFTGVVFSAITAGGSETRAAYQRQRLGYEPRHLTFRASLVAPGAAPEFLRDGNAWAVVKAMRPLDAEALKDPMAVRREEARALAELVSRPLVGGRS